MFVISRIRSAKFSHNVPKLLSCQIHSHRVLLKHTEHLNIDIKGQSLRFPFVWLRDNCQCEECFHRSAKSRILDWSKFDVYVQPRDISKEQNSLRVTWTDGHKSLYNLEWLKFRSFTPEDQKRYSDAIYKPKKITWHGNDFDTVFTKHDYNEILRSDEALYNWLHNLSVYGVALIKNTPHSETAVDQIVEKIGFTKRTHYGVRFVVQHVPNTSNVAYSSSNLQMHTDLPYYEYCPGSNLLHCLVQTANDGGDNLLSDCHYVAEYMKENCPEEYTLLTETEVEWSDIGVEHGNEFFKLYRSPVICLDRHGEIIRINFSIPQRGSHFPIPIDKVVPWYKAHSLFLNLNHQFCAKFKTQSGDILAFDNIRLLHGRSAYEDNANNVRKIIGAYVDWDEIYSRLRCIKVKLKNEEGIC